MKVSINGRNSPCPVAAPAAAGAGAAAAGAGVGAAGGLLGAGLSGLFAYRQQKRQMKHDKEMAGLNQQYILEQMAQGNEYQVEQWNRENAYNDPAAVRARYEAAGLNARAAMGEGSASGAGISGGLSGAPSGSGTGHSSDIMAASPFGGLGDAIMQGLELSERKRANDATIANQEADTSAKLINNLTLAESNLLELEQQRANIAKTLSDTSKTEQQISESKKRMEEIDQRIANMQEDIKVMREQVRESKTRQGLNIAQTNKVNEEAKTISSQRSALLDKIESETDLNESQKTYYRELGNKVEKEWEYVKKEVEAFDITLYSKLAQMTSSELRGWFDVLAEFRKFKHEESYKKMSVEEKNRANKIFFLKTVLPLLLK